MLGQTLRGRYQIIRLLGSGGFGETYLALDRDLPSNPQCVVKQLKSKNIDPSVFQTARRLFETEAQVLYRLGKHDRIPQLLAHFEEDQEFYLVQEFIEGEEFSHELIANQLMNEAEVIAFLEDILQTLAFVHQQNVIHRDIKPSNLIRRQEDGKFVLIDFGAVKDISTLVGTQEGQTAGTVLIGSSGYMPNEQLGGKPRFSSDIYALGMTAIQALTGVSPDELAEDPQTREISWHEYVPVGKQLAAILDKMVRSHFRDRYQSANEVLADLQKLKLKTSGLTHRLVLLGSPDQPFKKYSPILIILLTACMSFGLAKLWNFTNRYQQISIALVTSTASTQIPAVIEFLNQGKTLIELHHYEEALTILEKAIQIQPNNPEVLVARGEAKSKLQKYEEALQSFEEALKFKRDNSQAWYGRGIVLTDLNRYEEALTSLNNAVKIQPDYHQAWCKMAILLSQLEQETAAIYSLDQAIKIKPDYAETWYVRGVVLNKFYHHKEALEALEKTVELQPAKVEAWIERGLTLAKLKQYEKALDSFYNALIIKPNSPEVWAERGEVLGKLKRYEEALACLEKAIEIKANYAEAWYKKGIILEVLKKYALAIDSFDKAAQINPNYAEAWYQRGIVLEKMQKNEDAIASYNKAIQIWPANKEAIEKRQRLRAKFK